jgi:hypothetical protein
MKIYFEKDLQVLLFALLVSLSMLVSLPQVETAWTGVKEVYEEHDFGLHTLRKAMLLALASQQGTEIPFSLDARISDGGRLVWKTPRSSISACCGIHKRDRRQGTTVR